MNILVCVEQVPDPVSIEFDYQTGHMDKKRLVYITNPSDINALETAMRINEEGMDSVTVVSVGPERVERSLRQCKALGAGNAYRIWGPDWPQDAPAVGVAFAIARFVREKSFDLVLCGDTGDIYHGAQVPAWMAEFLNWPLITAATEVMICETGCRLSIKRKQERGFRQAVESNLPAVVAVDTSINTPRKSSLPERIDAEEAPINRLEVSLVSMLHMYEKPEIMSGLEFKLQPFKPEPHFIFAPDPSLSAEDRIDAFVSGGMEVKKGLFVKGKPEEMADHIISYMEKKQLIDAI